jgi:pantetheine-phosphate adenylyltransferase
MPRIALYAGSFDPVTNGHLDVVRHAVRLADRLVIAIGVHPGKTPLFTAEERTAMLHENCAPFAREAKCELSCTTFSNLGGGRGAQSRRDHSHPRRARRHRSRL